ncbi:MAG: transcription antitermination factor NusB [Planctomycetes bacterium]|nr:transcription antitermination factor NusB [Planctomycetota bacterium]MCB9871881.1 transcription antitermination factor NusB [Planctomycetota bacterium]MCB9888831.1 transcription antitermination factor NusB [Planctomycetota bacterium]
MRRRTKARELAVQYLYQLDLRGDEILDGVREFVADETDDEQVREFAVRLILGTRKVQAETDACLRDVARNWDLGRMATIDRNILRMAVFELLHCPDIPPKVTINEAIEIGKKFSTANSGAFINGILDRVRLDRLGRDGAAGGPGAPSIERSTESVDS